MDRPEIEARVKKVLAEQLAVDEQQVVPDARFAEDLNADSLTEFAKWIAETCFSAKLMWTYDGSNSMALTLKNCYYSGEWPKIDAEAVSQLITLNIEVNASTFGAEDDMTGVIASA